MLVILNKNFLQIKVGANPNIPSREAAPTRRPRHLASGVRSANPFNLSAWVSFADHFTNGVRAQGPPGLWLQPLLRGRSVYPLCHYSPFEYLLSPRLSCSFRNVRAPYETVLCVCTIVCIIRGATFSTFYSTSRCPRAIKF